MSRVFISYSHGEHEIGSVRKLVQDLRAAGLTVIIWEEVTNHGMRWSDWMEDMIDQSDYVLVVCSQSYRDRLHDAGPSGVQWEGSLIRQRLYGEGRFNRKFIPVLINSGDRDYIPGTFIGFQYYDVSRAVQREALIRRLGATRASGSEPRPAVHEDDGTVVYPDGHESPFLGPPASETVLQGCAELLNRIKAQLLEGGRVEICGVPGSGQTSLAIRVARDPDLLEQYRAGVLWASLGRTQQTTFLLAEWAAALGVVPRKPAPAEAEPAEDGRSDGDDDGGRSLLNIDWKAMREEIARRRLLLIVDNVWSDEVLEPFLRVWDQSRRSALLVTRRMQWSEPAFTACPGVVQTAAGFASFTVPALANQHRLDLLKQAAWEAGLVASVAANDDVSELVELVRGIPQALLLVGSYLRVRCCDGSTAAVKQCVNELQRIMRQRVRKAPVKRRGRQLPDRFKVIAIPPPLYAAIRLCYEAVGPSGQAALKALSLLPARPNSFSEAAALSVAAPSGDTLLPTDTLTRLVEYGLVDVVRCSHPTRAGDEERYGIHQTIREFVIDRLAGRERRSADWEPWQNLCRFYHDFARLHSRHYQLLRRESRNILALVVAASERRDVPSLLRTTSALSGFFESQGMYWLPELESYLRQALDQSANSPEIEIECLIQLARRAEKVGQYRQAVTYLDRCVPLARATKGSRPERLADTLLISGIVQFNLCDYARAQEELEEGYQLALRLFDRERICRFLERRCLIWMATGDRDKALRDAETAHVMAQRTQNLEPAIRALMQLELGRLALIGEDYREARTRSEEGLAIAEKESLGPEITAALLQVRARALIGAQAEHAPYPEAAMQLHRALDLARHIAHRWYTSFLQYELGKIYLWEEDLERAEAAFEEAIAIARELGSADLAAFGTWGLAQVAARQVAASRTIRLARQCLAALEGISHFKQHQVREFLVRQMLGQARCLLQAGERASACKHAEGAIQIIDASAATRHDAELEKLRAELEPIRSESARADPAPAAPGPKRN